MDAQKYAVKKVQLYKCKSKGDHPELRRRLSVGIAQYSLASALILRQAQHDSPFLTSFAILIHF